MKPGTFSNAMVASVGAYAEAVAELTAQNEQLHAALRAAAAAAEVTNRLTEQVRALTDEAHQANLDGKLDPVLARRVRAILDVLDALKRGAK